MASVYWTFRNNGTTVQSWAVPAGCTSFVAHLWGAAGGSGNGAFGGTPTLYNNVAWSQRVLANDRSVYSHQAGAVDSLAHQYGTNLGGYVFGSFTAPITSGAATWPSKIYLAVGNNGSNSSGLAGGAGGWPAGGNGGSALLGPSTGNAGGGGGGGATVLMTDTAFANPVMVAGGSGGSGGDAYASANMGVTGYGVLNTATVNPPFSTYTGPGDTNPVTYLPGLPYEAVQQTYVYNNGRTAQIGGAVGLPGGDAYENGFAASGLVSGCRGGGATTTAGGAAGAYAFGTAPTAGAKLGSTTSATGRGWIGSGGTAGGGGGGGGGGYYQGGGGGGQGTNAYPTFAGGGGGGSNWAATAAVGTMPAPQGVYGSYAAPPYSPSAAGGPSGTGGFAILLARVFPLSAVLAVNTDPMSLGVDTRTVSVTFRSEGSQSTNADVQMQAYRVGVSTDGGTTITWGPVQTLDTPGASASFNIGAGSTIWNPSATGTYDLYVDTQDTGGDWNTDISGTLDACAPAHFQVTVYTPPAAPVVTVGTITDNYTDANGVTGEGVPVSWTHPGGTPVSSIVSLLDSTGAVVNTITISGSTASTTLSWPNGNALGNKATVQYAATAGEYSAVGSKDFDISIDPPAQPVVSMTLDSDAGTISLLLEDGGGTYPTVKYDVFRSVTGQPEIRIAAGLYPNAVGQAGFTDIAVATDTQYSYKIRAYSQAGGYVETTNGTVTGS